MHQSLYVSQLLPLTDILTLPSQAGEAHRSAEMRE